MLNKPMQFKPRLKCNSCSINKIAILFFSLFFNKKKKKKKNTNEQKGKQITQNKQTETNKKIVCLSTPPNLNDTFFPIWQELQYRGMRKS
jgi:hypothetical protein